MHFDLDLSIQVLQRSPATLRALLEDVGVPSGRAPDLGARDAAPVVGRMGRA